MTLSFHIGKRLFRANCWVVAGYIKYAELPPLAVPPHTHTQPAACGKFISDALPFTVALLNSHSPCSPSRADTAPTLGSGTLCEAAAEDTPARLRGSYHHLLIGEKTKPKHILADQPVYVSKWSLHEEKGNLCVEDPGLAVCESKRDMCRRRTDGFCCVCRVSLGDSSHTAEKPQKSGYWHERLQK